MSETASTVVDMSGSSVLVWGEAEEDVRYIQGVVERVMQAGERAAVASDYVRDHAEFIADLRGAATMMGLAIPSGSDVVAPLRAFLLASRDFEGNRSEDIIKAANGKSEEERKAARRLASQHSGRRGYLDSAVYWMGRGLAALGELRAWETKTSW